MKSSLRSEPNSTAKVRKNPCKNPEVVSTLLRWLQESSAVLRLRMAGTKYSSLRGRNSGKDY